MAYTINLSDGSTFANVADGTINTESSLTVIGRNYAGYGEFLGENFMKLLENSANTSAPSTPLTGQMWYDKTNNVLKVYNGSLWREIGSSNSGTSAPPSPTEGDMWFDSTNAQLKVYNGTSWLVVGPSYTAGSGTSGSIVEIVTDNTTTDHTVVKIYVEDTVIGIWSADTEFTPNVAISGFITIKPGLSVSSNVPGADILNGTATDSQLLDGLDSSQFLRSDVNGITSGTLSVLNDTGLVVGAGSDLSMSVSGNDVYIKNITSDGDLILGVNDGGVTKSVITLDGATGLAILNDDPTATMGIATKNYVDSATGGATSTSLARDGSNTIIGNITPDGNNTRNLGATSTRFATVYATTFDGTASSAEYADIAERFESDTMYTPGTVVKLGGVAEITQAIDELSEDVFGVISTKAAYLMNSKAGTNDTHPPVAIQGRVPVRVVGKITKGQRLVSAGDGLAKGASRNELTSFNVIGRALEDKTTEVEGVIEAIVKIN